MARIYYIECAKCGEVTREPVPDDLDLIEADKKLKEMACLYCGCNDNNELERMLITKPKRIGEVEHGPGISIRPAH